MEGALNSGMCRCCASEGTFKDVSSKYQWMGEEEIYSEMLRDCFDITLTNAEDIHSGGICEVCITQLRNAANFKKQVLLTEEQFKRRLQDDAFKNDIIKIEVNALEDDDGNASDNNLSDDFSSPEYEVPIKMETEEKVKKRGKASASRAKKPKLESGDSSKSNRWGTTSVDDVDVSTLLYKFLKPKPEKNNWSVSIKGAPIQRKGVGSSSDTKPKIILRGVTTKVLPPLKTRVLLPAKTRVLLPAKTKVLPPPKTNVIPPAKTKKIQYIPTKAPQIRQKLPIFSVCSSKLKEGSGSDSKLVFSRLIDKHLHNVRQILFFTNATPLKTFDGIGYSCGYCNDQHPTPALLKQHCFQEHDDTAKKHFMKNACLTEYSSKLDITDFKCLLCDNSLVNLESAIEHLKSAHDKEFYDNIDNHILAFRFDSDGIKCSVCSKVNVSYKISLEHIRVHYPNYVCDICNVPFINRRTLQSHSTRHKQGDFPCHYCEKIFDTLTKRNHHEKFTHKGTPCKRNKCSHCGEKFDSYMKKIEHEVMFHGREPLQLKCMACDLVFNTRKNLTKHTKRDHLMERSHACALCDKRFFSSSCLKNHMLTHTGLRQFQCDVCLKTYGRKSTLREHMRIHEDDRRFKCTFCDQTFVQKCSLKSHLRSKHGEILNY